MKAKPTILAVGAIIVGTAILGSIVIALLWERATPPTFSSFVRRTHTYHEALAKACERVLMSVQEDTNATYQIALDDLRVDPLIRQLKPAEVLAARNLQIEDRQVTFVRLIIGNSVGGYSVIFQPIDRGGNTEWELVASQAQRNTVLWKGAAK